MKIIDAQREMRTNFLGGFAGQLVSGFIWLVSSAIWLWTEPRYGMAALFFGSMAIFPLTQGLLRMLGRSAKTSPENRLWALGAQIAFTVPINFLLVGGATLHHQDWFFPGAMIVVGSHYLPFITLYGMKMFGALAGLLILSGFGIALYLPSVGYLGGWLTAFTLIIFAFIGRQIVLNEGLKK
jgi:hypothetical protein